MILHVYFDGNCRPNPNGKGVIGFCVEEPEGDVVVREQGYLGEGAPLSQNLSEWCALLASVRYFRRFYEQQTPLFIGDAQVVIDSLREGCTLPQLDDVQARARKAVRAELDELNDYRVKWIAGTDNERADGLANSVYGSLKQGQSVQSYRSLVDEVA